MQLLTAHLTRFLFLLGICLSAQAEVSLPNIFGDHMVLQREQANPVWGKASPGEKVIVSIGGQSHATITTADGNAISIQLKHVSEGGLYTFDVSEAFGFEIAGEDQKFVWAEAKLDGGNKVKASSPQVPNPVAVRYAWGNNPVVNLQDRNGLPVTPFRTDDWPGITANNVK